jgi:hypothetical protein
MADLKISQLTAITTLTPATDVLPVVDVTGTTKKITTNQLLGSGGTATLASATITGDLTVDTSTLKVDSTNDRVGIGTASPAAGAKLGVLGATSVSTSDYIGASTWAARFIGSSNGASSGISLLTNSAAGQPTPASIHATPIADFRSALTATYSADNTGAGYFAVNRFNPSGSNTLEHYKIDNAGVATWSNVGGVAGTAMTLNSTGLGVGVVSSSAKLEVNGAGRFSGFGVNSVGLNTTGTAQNFVRYTTAGADCYIGTESSVAGGFFTGSTAYATCIYNASNTPIQFFTNGSVKATLDASGNLLVGTTSSLRNTAHSFKAAGSTNSFWAGAFQHTGTTDAPRLLSLDIPNSNDSNAYIVYATNSGGNCFNVLGNGSLQNSTGTYGTISDLRLKENISDARNYLADLLKLRVVKYSLKSESSAVATKIGFIAQEVEQVFPTLVETNSDEVKSIKTTVLIPMLLKAIQELTARVEALEA